MDCYFYSKNEKEIIHANKKDDHWELKRKSIYPISLDSNLISVIEPERYNYWIDRFLEGIPYPNVNNSKTLLIPEVGKNYIIGEQVMTLEEIVPNRALIFSILKGTIDGFQEITEDEANILGITYKEGLISISPDLKLREYNPEEVEFNSEDLGTYPRSTIEGCKTEIHHLILSLGGFKKTEDERIIETPHGDLIDLEYFLVTLGIRLNHSIPSVGKTAGYEIGDSLEFSYITDSFKGSKKLCEEDIIDTNGKINLIVRFKNKKGHGISALSVRNLSPKELFKVSWDVAFSLKRERLIKSVNERMMVCPNHHYQIFRKEKSGMLFRMTNDYGKYIKLIEKM